MAAFAGVVFMSDALGRALIFDRASVLHGEVWRLWTGNVVHFGESHLLWNLAVLVPTGIWAETIAPRATRWLLALAPVLIGATLLVLQPTLGRYAGLSGVAAGLLALLAFTQLTRPRDDHWFWWALLGLLALKIVAEAYSDHPLLARFSQPGLHTAPLAHLAGIAVAAVIHRVSRRI